MSAWENITDSRFGPSSPHPQSAVLVRPLLDVATMAQTDEAKRARAVLTIAQHRFKQALKKEDPEARLPSLAVEISTQFCNDIDAVLRQNTRVNIQVSNYEANDHLSLGAD
jgi:hypothetical protein